METVIEGKGFRMDILKQYKNYRKIGMQLNNKLIKGIDRDTIMKAAKLLGIVEGDTIVFEEEYESDVLMDVCINEKLNEGKTVVENYIETGGWTNDIEKDILNALMASYTSLFRVDSICKNESSIVMKDMLNDSRELKLIDIGFSNSATEGMLIFTRIIPFDNFNMTSGISFPFVGDIEEYLLRRYRRIKRKYKAEGEAIARFTAFFELNRTDGVLVNYQKVR